MPRQKGPSEACGSFDEWKRGQTCAKSCWMNAKKVKTKASRLVDPAAIFCKKNMGANTAVESPAPPHRKAARSSI